MAAPRKKGKRLRSMVLSSEESGENVVDGNGVNGEHEHDEVAVYIAESAG